MQKHLTYKFIKLINIMTATFKASLYAIIFALMMFVGMSYTNVAFASTEQDAEDAIAEAEDAISDAEEEIDDADNDGVNVSEAEDLIIDAKDALEEARKRFS